MKLFKKAALTAVVTASALVSFAAQAQQQTCDITSATVTQLFSTTFDGLVFSKAVSDDGTFFGNVPDIANPIWGGNRAVLFEVVPGGNPGGGTITFDGTSLYNLAVTFSDQKLSILDAAPPNNLVTTTSGGSLVIENVANIDGGNDANFDVGGLLSAGSAVQTIDFSQFGAAGAPGSPVVTCTDTTGNCALIPGLNLDGVRYTLEGTPSGVCTDSYTLRVQTNNNSYYEVDITTSPIVQSKNVPVPAMFVYLTLAFMGLVGVKLSRRA